MARITELPDAGVATDTDLIEVIQTPGGIPANVKMPLSALPGSKDIANPASAVSGALPILADEFNDATFHADWVRVEDAARLRWTEGGDVLSAVVDNVVVGASNKPHALLRPFTPPASDAPFTVDAATRRMNTYATSYIMAGLLLSNGTDYATSSIMWNMPYQSTGTAGAQLSVRWGANWNAGTDAGSPNYSGDWATMLYQRMIYLGGGAWKFRYSCDGIGWFNAHGASHMFAGFVPTHVGFGVGTWGTAGQRGMFTAEYLRVHSGDLDNLPAQPHATI